MDNSSKSVNTYKTNDLQSNLQPELKEFLSKRVSLKKRYNVAETTNQKREDIINTCFKQLTDDGFKVLGAKSLKPKHIQHLMTIWEKKELSISTLTNRLSVLRIFTEFFGKRGMIGAIEDYISPDYLAKKSRVPKKAQTAEPVEVDTQSIVQKATEIDVYSGHQLKLMVLFGLSSKESTQFCPFKSDYADYLLVMQGTRGGRSRMIKIDTPEKKELMTDCKKLVGKIGADMRNPKRSKTQEINRLYYVMRLLGITQAQLGITPQALRQKQEVPTPKA